MERKAQDDDNEVYSITSARQAHTEDISHRERNYAVSMGIRTICFVGGVIAWFHIMWLGVVLFIGALVLPYTSVILANAGVRSAGAGSNLTNVATGELGEGTQEGGRPHEHRDPQQRGESADPSDASHENAGPESDISADNREDDER